MGVTERRSRHRLALRHQILNAAREVFVREGYESVSMRKIAERIKYSPTTIYLYFRDKADLLHCLTEETFGRLAEIMERITRDTPDVLERLRKGLRAYVDFGLSHPSDYRVAFMLDYGKSYTSPIRDPHSAAARAYGTFTAAVQACIEQGRFRPIDVETASQVLWAPLHGVTSLLISEPDFPWIDRERLITMVIDSALRGFQNG